MDDRETRRQGDKVTRRFSPSPPLLVTPCPPVGRAHDDFDVTAVSVAVTKADGSAVEEGSATETPANSGRWVYKAMAAVPTGTTARIDVTATDGSTALTIARPGGGRQWKRRRRSDL